MVNSCRRMCDSVCVCICAWTCVSACRHIRRYGCGNIHTVPLVWLFHYRRLFYKSYLFQRCDDSHLQVSGDLIYKGIPGRRSLTAESFRKQPGTLRSDLLPLTSSLLTYNSKLLTSLLPLRLDGWPDSGTVFACPSSLAPIARRRSAIPPQRVPSAAGR